MATIMQTGNDKDAINVGLTDRDVNALLRTKPPARKARVVVASAGPVQFDVSPVDLLKKRVKVTVLLMGIPVGDSILDEGHTEVSLGPNVGLAKASITLSISWQRKKLQYTAKACVRNWRFKWKCADYSGTLASW